MYRLPYYMSTGVSITSLCVLHFFVLLESICVLSIYISACQFVYQLLYTSYTFMYVVLFFQIPTIFFFQIMTYLLSISISFLNTYQLSIDTCITIFGSKKDLANYMFALLMVHAPIIRLSLARALHANWISNVVGGYIGDTENDSTQHKKPLARKASHNEKNWEAKQNEQNPSRLLYKHLYVQTCTIISPTQKVGPPLV